MADAPEDCDGALPSTFDGVDGAALALHSRPASTSSEDPEGYSSRAVADTNRDGLVLDLGSNQEDVNHSQEDAARFKRRLTLAFRPSEVLESAATDPYTDHVESATLAASLASTSPSRMAILRLTATTRIFLRQCLMGRSSRRRPSSRGAGGGCNLAGFEVHDAHAFAEETCAQGSRRSSESPNICLARGAGILHIHSCTMVFRICARFLD